MRHAPDVRSSPFDPKQGGLLLANMLSAWLDGAPSGDATAEAVHEPKDRRTSSQPIRLCLPAPVDARPMLHHQESTERQYALREKAQELGWSEASIRTLDRDLGKS